MAAAARACSCVSTAFARPPVPLPETPLSALLQSSRAGPFVRLLAIVAVGWSAVAAQVRVDDRIPGYEPAPGVSGIVKSVGSDTMNDLMTLWSEAFVRRYPNVRVEIEGKGSSTAPAALREGSATFGPMSRPMKAQEQDEFEKSWGFKATQVPVAVDMLVVVVHRDNPIAERGLTFEEIDAVFSRTRKRGSTRDLTTWGDLGLDGEWAERPISLYGRNSASGTYGFFKQNVLADGDFKVAVKEQPGSSAVIQGVATDRFGIGYSGIGFVNADVRAVPLGPDADHLVEPLRENLARYPLRRHLLISLNQAPHRPSSPLQREFLRFVYSREGQHIVVQGGYLPLPFPVCERSLRKIGVELQPADVDR